MDFARLQEIGAILTNVAADLSTRLGSTNNDVAQHSRNV